MSVQFSGNYEQLDRLAEEFADRLRRGEHPSLKEYTDRYPELAAEIRELFPAMVEMERAEAAVEPRTPAVRQVGDYSILREIGRGGMGVVYEAEQASLGRRVALKVLPIHATSDSKALERFRREARAAARLHHTNIVPVFEVGQDGEACFYAMQFIQGQGLDLVLEELRRLRASTPGRPASYRTAQAEHEGSSAARQVARSLLTGQFVSAEITEGYTEGTPPEPVEVLGSGAVSSSVVLPGKTDFSSVQSDRHHYFLSIARIGQQVAGALAYAHARGIIHRDIKPSNLLLDASGVVWVTDFGLAKTEEEGLTETGDLLGTFRYMAPERFHGKCDARADVYALGLTLYEMLVLRPAFDAPQRAQLMKQVQEDDPPRPRSLDSRIPRDLETIVLKAIAKSPERRYPSADEMAEDLRRFLDGEPIKARRTSLPERTRLWARRHPALAGLYVVLFATVLCTTVLSIYLNGLYEEAETNRQQKAKAEELAKEELWKSYLAQARATRMTRQPGQRIQSLTAIAKALELPLPKDRTLDELRNEAVAALCLPDWEVSKEWEGFPFGSTAFAIDVNFERYARADKDGSISVRRIADDAELWRLPGFGPLFAYDGLRFSPDGRFLHARAASKSYARLWKLTGDKPQVIREGIHWSFAFRPDSREMAVVDREGSVIFLETETGKVLRRFPTGVSRVEEILWNPKRPELAVWSRSHWRLLDVETGKQEPLVSAFGGLSWMAWHPDGRILAGSGETDHMIRLWDAHARRLVRPPLQGPTIQGIVLAFNQAGDRLLSTDWSLNWRLWDVRSGQQLLSQSANGVNLQFSADDSQVAANLTSPRAKLYRVFAGREFETLVVSNGQRRLAFDHRAGVCSSDGRLIATARQGGISLVDVARMEEAALLPAVGDRPLRFESDGRALWTFGNGGLRRWPIRVETGSALTYHIGTPELRYGSLPVERASASDDLSVIAVAQGAANVLKHDGQGTYHQALVGPHADVRYVAVSPDGRWVIAGSHNLDQPRAATVLDTQTGKIVHQFPVIAPCPVFFSPDGRWLITGGGSYRLWRVGTWEEGPPLASPVNTGPCSFSPDGRVVAVGSDPGVIRLIEVDTGREIVQLTGPTESRLLPLAFTPDDGRLIAWGSESQALHGFDLRAIRAGLKALNLDWDAPPLPAAESTYPSPIQVWLEFDDSPRQRIANASSLLAVNANDISAYQQRGRAYQQLGDHQRAISDFSAVLRHQSKNAQAYMARAESYWELRDHARSLADTRKAVELDGKNPIFLNNLAWRLGNAPQQLRQTREAVELARKAMDLKPDEKLIRNTLGFALYRNGDYQEAIEILEKNLEPADGSQDAYDLFPLAMCYQRRGDGVKARECYEKALRWLSEHRSELQPSWRRELKEMENETDAVLKEAGKGAPKNTH